MPITNYLNQTATRKPKASLDKFGKVTTGTSASIKCRIQEKIVKLVDDKGNEYLTDAELWVLPTQTLVLDDIITFNAQDYKIVRIDTKRGLEGNINHIKALLKRAL